MTHHSDIGRIGGLAALVCGATYIIGFAFLVTVLAPLGYGSREVDACAVVTFIHDSPGILITWNTTIYVVNALALVVLVVALGQRLDKDTPGWAAVTRGFGLIWATLVLGAGMIANVAAERAAHVYTTDPRAAADLWSVLHSIELGLGGGNEIAGGVWIGSVGLAGLAGCSLPRPIAGLGLLTGLGGIATVVPPLGETAGALFGMGAIAWFVAVGLSLTLGRRTWA